jgi:hypothetical protein
MTKRGLVAVAVAALLIALLWTHSLTLPNWEHPSGRDYDQAAILVFIAIVVVAACSAWFAWRLRRER